ncbi:MAG: winged helix-turn-helix domain-containing protein [Candidatus Edwardsbacteria bacterium]|nr:winged helix-turn-helix domain-containing protein [Candidatus Edwardsbacteria bacterium]
MLEPIFGSAAREIVLRYLHCRGEGYAREIARFYGTGLDPIQKQLGRLENGGVVYSRTTGRTRLYALDPRYPFLPELRALLDKSLAFLDKNERERLVMSRRRPRRKGKHR